MTQQHGNHRARPPPLRRRRRREPRIRVKGLGKRYGTLEGLPQHRLRGRRTRDRRHRRPVGLRQDHAAALHRRAAAARCRRDLGRRSSASTEPIAGVAMVFQHFGLFPWKTVFDNVAYGLRMAGAPKAEIERKVPEFIKLVGLAGFEKAFPYQMSGGMQQRCGLARALARRAERAADGRAVRGGRRADARDPAIRTAAHLGGAADRDDLRHPFDRGGGAARPPRHRAQGPARRASTRPSPSTCRSRARARRCASRALPNCASASGAR